jgi:hypothetical protein
VVDSVLGQSSVEFFQRRISFRRLPSARRHETIEVEQPIARLVVADFVCGRGHESQALAIAGADLEAVLQDLGGLLCLAGLQVGIGEIRVGRAETRVDPHRVAEGGHRLVEMPGGQ